MREVVIIVYCTVGCDLVSVPFLKLFMTDSLHLQRFVF